MFILISNLFNWIKKDDGRSIDEDAIVRGINYLLEGMPNKNVWLINTEMNKDNYNNRLTRILKRVYDSISYSELYISKYIEVSAGTVRFKNPDECYWREQRGVKEYCLRTEYHYMYTHAGSIIDNINSALRKIKFNITNKMELLYTRNNINELYTIIIEYIKNNKLSGNYMQYEVVKQDGNKRYLIEEDIMDSLVEIIVLNNKGKALELLQDDRVSYGNRLDTPISNNICIPYGLKYYKGYKEEIEKSIKTPRYKTYFKIDISKYYNNISHERLYEIINNSCKEMKNFLDLYLSRDYIGCTPMKKGVPQGVEVSAILANAYLAKFDEWFIKKFWGGEIRKRRTISILDM